MLQMMLMMAVLTSEPDARLLDAIRQVESSGNIQAVGDHGKSLGAYQIQESYWRDGCEFGKVKWPYKPGVYNDAKCRQVIRWYWQRYGAKTDKEKARMQNGGPRGPQKKATLPYWRKVQAAMKESP